MKRRPPWKRIWACTALAALCCMLIAEFGAVFWFFAGVFGLSGLWVFGRAWREARRDRNAREDAETAREEIRQMEISRRREACRKARYHREEQERIEAHLQAALGPIETWDLERSGEALCLDAALIPPTEALPYWKAATMGAGAYTMEAGGCRLDARRVELAMALPPDWDPSDRWPVQVLRDAARRFLIIEGGVGDNSIYRGFSLINAGFAGAVVMDDFPGLPALGAAAMPGAPAVRLLWLVPLLKPELDYFQQRGPANLERRFPADSPWADRARKPLSAFGTWFQEDIAPFTWSEDDGLYCLGLETGECRMFSDGSDPAWDWEDLARRYLRWRQPDDEPFVEFACEERVFFAASRDEEIMRKLALGLSDLLRDGPQEARRMLY